MKDASAHKQIIVSTHNPEVVKYAGLDLESLMLVSRDKEGYSTIAEIGKERIRRAAAKIKEENPDYDGDLGFKVFKLDSTNIKPWEVDFDLTERTLEDFISNIKSDRREEDVLCDARNVLEAASSFV